MEVDTGVASPTIRPWVDPVKKMIPNGRAFVKVGFEEMSERKHDAGRKEGNEQDECARKSEPPGG
jgi:hypothetical protein